MDELGGKFWLTIAACTILGGIALMIFMLFVDLAWYAWGGFGALLAILLVFSGVAYFYDRRAQDRYEDLPEG